MSGFKIEPTPLQWTGLAIYLPATVLALWVSLSQVRGDGFLIILLCLPAILTGMIMMAVGGRK